MVVADELNYTNYLTEIFCSRRNLDEAERTSDDPRSTKAGYIMTDHVLIVSRRYGVIRC